MNEFRPLIFLDPQKEIGSRGPDQEIGENESQGPSRAKPGPNASDEIENHEPQQKDNDGGSNWSKRANAKAHFHFRKRKGQGQNQADDNRQYSSFPSLKSSADSKLCYGHEEAEEDEEIDPGMVQGIKTGDIKILKRPENGV